MPVVIDEAQLINAIKGLGDWVGNRRVIFEELGRGLQRYVRDTITGGGRHQPFAPLSQWTTKRTGRSKPLVTLAQFIRYEADASEVVVYFNAPSTKWNMEQHDKGWQIPARIGRPVMRVPFAAGGAAFFKSAKGATVPARQVWPDEAEAEALVRRAVADWIAQGAVTSWHP